MSASAPQTRSAASAQPDMEYAHPGAPDRYTPRSMRDLYAQPGALSSTVIRGGYDTRTVDQRHREEIAALAAQVSALSADNAALRARLNQWEAAD